MVGFPILLLSIICTVIFTVSAKQAGWEAGIAIPSAIIFGTVVLLTGRWITHE